VRHGVTLMAGLVATLFAGGVAAHDLASDPLPDSPGWRIGAAAAVSWASSQHAWPAPRWPGFTGSGQTPSNREGASLEHATLDAAASVGDRYGAYLAIGKHGSDQPHTEAARVEGRWRLDLDTLAVQLGRDHVPMGSALTSAGHLDRYAQPPLIKRIALNDDWIDDGLNLHWQRGRADGVQSVDLGLWKARTYPGGAPAGRLGRCQPRPVRRCAGAARPGHAGREPVGRPHAQPAGLPHQPGRGGLLRRPDPAARRQPELGSA
jgi:hypothetical protein